MIAQVLSPVRERTFVPFVQCAWCGSISLLGHYLHLPGVGKFSRVLTIRLPMIAEVSIGISHGICPSCAAAVSERAARAS